VHKPEPKKMKALTFRDLQLHSCGWVNAGRAGKTSRRSTCANFKTREPHG